MAINVVCVGGPSEYAERSFSGMEPDDTGYLYFPDSTFGGPPAWYRIDYDAEPVPSEHGPAQPARYVGETKTG